MKFNYVRLRNGKVLGIWKSDDKYLNKNNNVRSRWDLFPGTQIQVLELIEPSSWFVGPGKMTPWQSEDYYWWLYAVGWLVNNAMKCVYNACDFQLQEIVNLVSVLSCCTFNTPQRRVLGKRSLAFCYETKDNRTSYEYTVHTSVAARFNKQYCTSACYERHNTP